MSETMTTKPRRFVASLLLLGAALLAIGNTTHPIDTTPTATSRMELAASSGWMPIHLTIAVGILAVVGALTLLPWAIDQPRGAAFARLGAAAALIGGTALVLVFGALDGYAQTALADAWHTSTGADREAVETIAIALEIIDSGMTAIGILVLFGFAMAAVGAAIITSRTVARWLGWSAVAIGVAGTVTGTLFAVQGPTPLVINGLFRPVAMAATLYFVAFAIALRRSQPRPGTASRRATHTQPPPRPENPDDTIDALPA
jgi:hypothetical protein